MAPTPEGSKDALLPDFPKGPLHAYRVRASFSWKEMALFLEGEDVLRFKVRPCWPTEGLVGASVHWQRCGFPGPWAHLCKVRLFLGAAQAGPLFAPRDGGASGTHPGAQPGGAS